MKKFKGTIIKIDAEKHVDKVFEHSILYQLFY